MLELLLVFNVSVTTGHLTYFPPYTLNYVKFARLDFANFHIKWLPNCVDFVPYPIIPEKMSRIQLEIEPWNPRIAFRRTNQYIT